MTELNLISQLKVIVSHIECNEEIIIINCLELRFDETDFQVELSYWI